MKNTGIIAVLSGLCVIASIQAQTNEGKNQNKETNVSAAASSETPGFSIDFPGGTPGQLIDAMAKASGTRPNVIIPSHVANAVIPKFKFQNVSNSQVFDALNMVSDEKGVLSLRWISEGPKDGPRRVWTLTKAPQRTTGESCKVVFIGNLLDSFQLDDINAAIRTSWEMLGKSSNPSLKFHKETKLLIAKGSEEELKLVFEVLKSLGEAAEVKKQASVAK